MKKNFFNKKRKSPSSFDEINIVLHSSRDLSKEQKDTIKSVIREALKNKSTSTEILDNIREKAGVFTGFIFISRDEDCIEVFF